MRPMSPVRRRHIMCAMTASISTRPIVFKNPADTTIVPASPGTPVVASNLDGYRNVATDDETALLVETGNVANLASARARVLVDPQLT